ncbi:MAG: baseplate J/gp47 family protein [Rhodobacteraceae bacterium]|nr:baseplate J/gp47 family protein [Paracoccaceae bacterium]
MAGGFTQIDLTQLPPPDVVEALDFETIRAGMVADLTARAPDLAAVLALESEPAVKILEVAAYRELLLRQRVNDAARAVMLASAVGADLDQLGALFGVVRFELAPGDPAAVPPVAAVMESDGEFRRRIQLSLEGFSTAGPEGAYLFHALSAHADVLDASAISPTPGDVVVSVLSRTGDGTASDAVLDAVRDVLTAEDVRPLTDAVTVQSAAIVAYTIEATLLFRPGPDRTLVMAEAQAAAQAYADAQHLLGQDITLSGIYAALHRPGVHGVTLTSPAADIVIDPTEAPFAALIDLYDGGVHG